MSGEMTVGDLMSLLEDEPEDAVVRIVHQPSWPLQETVGGIARGDEILPEEPDEEEAQQESESPSTVYLVATGHPRTGNPYGSRRAWDVMRRR